MKNISLFPLFIGLLLTGCSGAENEPIAQSYEMVFEANFPSSRATATSFEPGDCIGIFVTEYNGDTPSPLQISGNYANNIKSTFDGTKWNNSQPIYWGEGKFDIFAYYPYDSHPNSVDEYSFDVRLDQSLEASGNDMSNLEASDLLWTKTSEMKRSDRVPLNFHHIMSKLVVNLIKGMEYTGEIPADAVVRIHNTVPDAVVDLSTGIVMKHSRKPVSTITARQKETGSYEAIIVPQRLDNRVPLIEVLSNGVSYLIDSKFVFRSGVMHTINITLNNNPDKVKIEIGGEIIGWN